MAGNPCEEQPSTSDENPKPKGGCSTADMAPLEFKKRLFVDIEKYPNLLKRYQEGKVKVHASCTEDERLNKIRQKVISTSAFNKYLSKTVDETNKLQKPILSNTPGAADTNDDQSTGSSGEGDDSETDPNYNPTKDVDNEDMATKRGSLRLKMKVITQVCLPSIILFRIIFKYLVFLPSIIVFLFKYFSSIWLFLILPIFCATILPH